jgi:replicative DNA helicase
MSEDVQILIGQGSRLRDQQDWFRSFGPKEFNIGFGGWPQNVAAEAALLGSMLIDNRIALNMTGRLQEDHFFEPLHGRIWMALVRLVGAGKVVTPVTLKPLFEDDYAIKALGGVGYLVKLTADGSALVGANDFADQIIELARRRRLMIGCLEAAHEFSVTTYDEGVEVEEQVGRLNNTLWQDDGSDVKKPLNSQSAVDRVIERQEEIHTRGFVDGATSLTIPDITDIIGPLSGGNVTYIGARPSVGKTALALSLSLGLASNGHPTEYLHNEMNRDDISMRHVTDLCFATGNRISLQTIRYGTLKPDELFVLDKAQERAALLPLRMHDIADRDIEYVRALARRSAALWAAKGRKLQVLVIDYLQKMNALDPKGHPIDNSKQRVDRVSRGLMQISKELDLHVIALTQLGRGVEERPDRRPRLSDLKESGDLEQDADNVLLLWRPELHLEENEPPRGMAGTKEAKQWEEWEIELQTWRGKMEIIGAKVRHGRKKNRRVRFYGDYSAVRGTDFNESSTGDLFEDHDESLL